MFSRTGYVDQIKWDGMVAFFCACVLLGVLIGTCMFKALSAVRAWREREQVGWLDESRSTSAAPDLYPDPVCEWCGGVMDGKGCKCDGGGL